VWLLLGESDAKQPRTPTDDLQFDAWKPTPCTALLQCFVRPPTQHLQRSVMQRCVYTVDMPWIVAGQRCGKCLLSLCWA